MLLICFQPKKLLTHAPTKYATDGWKGVVAFLLSSPLHLHRHDDIEFTSRQDWDVIVVVDRHPNRTLHRKLDVMIVSKAT